MELEAVAAGAGATDCLAVRGRPDPPLGDLGESGLGRSHPLSFSGKKPPVFSPGRVGGSGNEKLSEGENG